MTSQKAQIPVPNTDRPDNVVDPVPAYAFYIEIDNIIQAGFLSCTGLTMRREAPKIVAEGGLNNAVHILPTPITYGQVTLRHGVTYSLALLNWFLEGAEDGKIAYRQVTIYQVVPYVTGKVVRRYHLAGVIPVTWSGPGLDTGSAEIAVESLELAFSSMTIDQ